LALAQHYYVTKQWDECLLVAKKALEYKEKPMGFLAENWAWSHMAHDLVAVSAWQLNDFKTAVEHGRKAVEISPSEERLISNLKFYESKVTDGNV
jgi:Flp pilus assembly protein TadD